MTTISKVISGGQTGADRGALNAAILTETPHGGWCPAGRKAEDGAVPRKYDLQCTESDAYEERTAANAQEGDATLVFTHGAPTGGSELTLRLCREHNKPRLSIDLDHVAGPEAVRLIERWLGGATQLDLLADHGPNPPDPCILNVAGQRESEAPGIGAAVKRIMVRILAGGAIPEQRRPFPKTEADRTQLGFD